jgi:hypothetical protein
MGHKSIAIQLFNETWDLIDQKNRTNDQDALMIHKAHASLYHWLQIGTVLHFQRGEWLISHVYSLLNLAESALYHAKRCLQITLENSIDDFDLTFAYEAMARAYKITNHELKNEYLSKAEDSLSQIKKMDDRLYAMSQLQDLK